MGMQRQSRLHLFVVFMFTFSASDAKTYSGEMQLIEINDFYSADSIKRRLTATD